MRFPGNVVTEEDTRARGAGSPDKCFYCNGKPGGEHDAECVCIDRPVKIRLTVELIVTMPRSWTPDQIAFRLNESSWCADNILRDLERTSASPAGCLCYCSGFEFLGEATLEESVEAGLIPDTEGDPIPDREES